MDAYVCGAWRAATCREMTSFEFYIAPKNICCITDVINEIICHHITWFKKWMCTFVRHDELRRAVTSFEFCIVVKNTCCIKDVMIEVFYRHITSLETWMHTFVRHNELRRAATWRDELLISYCGEKYMLYYRCNERNYLSPYYITSNVNVYVRAAWRAATCCDEL
jgi:hypothetical protein